ncbi:hypothetical protein GCM10010919_27790 [Alishewanella longhuensis]|uniref:Transposase n=1 Tax=Alishewanella longhuensis TaxID=1091037 RepID=A0ABQ3L2R1_9ALTE|nr:hypothetical protein [Alishewanella longhuensis]GHG74373.1 hypothetical protein GCM10010919_27790 [Alishewanella longhuensis]
MAFLVNQKFEAEAVLISNLSDGTRLFFAKGRFDHWCIYHVRNQFAHAVRDEEVFFLMQKYTTTLQRFWLYRDFLTVFKLVTNDINYGVVNNITRMAKQYEEPNEVQFILTFLYAGMVAEENKQNAILKKYIKRLGVHQLLIECMPARMAANYSRQKKWRELQLECEARGFFSQEAALKLIA